MHVSIVGFGRFGRLIASLLDEYHHSALRISATSRRDHAAEAAAVGIAWHTLAEAASADVVILCVPIRELEGALDRLRPLLRPGTLVVDTCSVKMYPVRQMIARLPRESELLGMHPMFGPDSIRDFGIAGQRLVSCPLRISPQRLAVVEGWFTTMGIEILRLTPEEHDRQAAISQGLVHFLGRAVARAGFVAPAVSTANAGRLFDLVRSVTADSPELFADLERYNPFAAAVRRELLTAAQQIEDELTRE